MFGRSYWNPAMNPGKSGELRKARLSEHIRAGAGHVRFWLLESGKETGYVQIFWRVWFKRDFHRFALCQLIQCTLLDSIELLGHK
jgi:hypothetical protein